MGNSEPLATVADIIWGMHQKLQDFRGVQFCYLKRQRNRFAHVWAQYAKGFLKYVIWIKENSSVLESILTPDVLNFFSS